MTLEQNIKIVSLILIFILLSNVISAYPGIIPNEAFNPEFKDWPVTSGYKIRSVDYYAKSAQKIQHLYSKMTSSESGECKPNSYHLLRSSPGPRIVCNKEGYQTTVRENGDSDFCEFAVDYTDDICRIGEGKCDYGSQCTSNFCDDGVCGSCEKDRDCDTGVCSGKGICIEPSCRPKDDFRCYNDDVYWYDSCGERDGIKDDCTNDEFCSNGECKERPSTNSCDNLVDNGGKCSSYNDMSCGSDNNPYKCVTFGDILCWEKVT